MKNIVIIVVEKIQRCIFKKIDMSQNDDSTLKSTISVSENIATSILLEIEKEFRLENKNREKILWISGKVIFYTDLLEDTIQEKLKSLYKKVYLEYHGEILLNYATFSDNNSDKIKIIEKANSILKNNENKSKILKDNRDILFKFQEIDSTSENTSINKDDESNIFATSLDDLNSLDKNLNIIDKKIAIVKGDINNLGNIMKKIKNYSIFSEVSSLLEKNISKKNFAEYIKEFYLNRKRNIMEHKIVPFYIAGDDIFYAVSVDALFDSIEILHLLIKDINEKISKYCNLELSIAVGVVFVDSHLPIRYYRDIVEIELQKAKNSMKMQTFSNSLLGVSIIGNIFYIYKEKLGKGERNGFRRFYREIIELKSFMKKKIFSRTELHNLLINLETTQDENQRILYTLYFCKPNLHSWKNLNEDIYFKYYLLSHLIEDKDTKEEKFFAPKKIEKILLPKLKLILFLLKDYYLTHIEFNDIYKYIISEKRDDQKRRIESVMFHKPINFILNSKENKENNIIRLFAKKKFKEKKQLYIFAKFEPSIFFRAKNLIQAGKSEQVLKMFENYNTSFNPSENTSVHILSFNNENFQKEFSNIENNIWLDKLILLYQYNQQRIRLKTFKKNEDNKK